MHYVLCTTCTMYYVLCTIHRCKCNLQCVVTPLVGFRGYVTWLKTLNPKYGDHCTKYRAICTTYHALCIMHYVPCNYVPYNYVPYNMIHEHTGIQYYVVIENCISTRSRCTGICWLQQWDHELILSQYSSSNSSSSYAPKSAWKPVEYEGTGVWFTALGRSSLASRALSWTCASSADNSAVTLSCISTAIGLSGISNEWCTAWAWRAARPVYNRVRRLEAARSRRQHPTAEKDQSQTSNMREQCMISHKRTNGLKNTTSPLVYGTVVAMLASLLQGRPMYERREA